LVSRFTGTMDFEQLAIERARKKKLSSVPSQKKVDAPFGTALTEVQVTALTERAKAIGAGISTGGLGLGGGLAAAGPLDIAKGVGEALLNPIESIESIVANTPVIGQQDFNFPGLIEGAKALTEAGRATFDIVQEIGGLVGLSQGPVETAQNIAGIVQSQGGAPMPVPGTGRPLTSATDISVGGLAPSMGTITRVWDTWPGPGVTGGGRAPIFFRTIDGKTFVRKIDGTIKKIPKSTNLVLNTRKINLNTFIRMDRAIERISSRIAKKSKRLKRQ